MQPGQQLAEPATPKPTSGLMARIREMRSKPAGLSHILNSLLTKQSGQSWLNTGRQLGRRGLRFGRNSFTRASQFTSDELSPRAAKAARKVRYHARPENLGKDYRHFLHLTQEIAYDRAIEKLFFVPARGYIPLDKLTIDSPNRQFGHDYHPVHRLSFDWAMAQIPDPLRDFTFVDYGAGRGRALLLAAQYPFRKIVGVEFARELQDDALMNIAQFPRSLMKCRDVDCLLMDAVDFPVPETKGVFLFNDSFDREVLETVLARTISSYRANPRRIYLVFVRPPQAEELDDLMERTVIFEPIYHSTSEKMRMQILSPDQVQIFRTLV